jgi:hypothetical protein
VATDPRWRDVRSPLLAICTPPDLARLLRTAMTTAGLTARRLAARTGINPSQVYLLTDPTRGSLPRNRQQLATFLRACRLREHDIQFVLARWAQLDKLRRHREPPQLPPPAPHTPHPHREGPMHSTSHPLAGQTVTVTAADRVVPGATHTTQAVLEDWWDRLNGDSWMLQNSPVTVAYGQRRRQAGLPVDDEVVYVKAGGLGHLAHASEITAAADDARDS